MSSDFTGTKTRSLGAFLGLAVGDALGAPIEFKQRDTYEPVAGYGAGGPFQLEAGYWTDDTIMALCLAETLLEKGGYDGVDYRGRLLRWVDEGYNSLNGTCFDVGATTLQAIRAFQRFGLAHSGATDQGAVGNSSIMRLAPVPLFYQEDAALAEHMAMAQGNLTHNHHIPLNACRLLSTLILEGIKTGNKTRVLASIKTTQVCGELTHLTRGDYRQKSRDEITSDGYVVSTLEAALWAVCQTHSFKDAALLAVNLGEDADTVGAVTGQIAGAIYGIEAIPDPWLAELAQAPRLVEVAEQLFDNKHCS